MGDQVQIYPSDEHAQSNCFLMVVMCHGTKKGKLFHVKENEAFRIDQLIEEVSATRTWNGKQKLLIFDTCRGGMYFNMINV